MQYQVRVTTSVLEGTCLGVEVYSTERTGFSESAPRVMDKHKATAARQVKSRSAVA